MFPAILFFLVGLELAYDEKKVQLTISKFKEGILHLKMNNAAYTLIILGVGGITMINIVPQAFKFVMFIVFLLFFPGSLYLYFKPNSSRIDKGILVVAVLWIIISAIISTMFTIIAYLGMTIIATLAIKFKISFFKKLFIFLLLTIFLMNIQYTKMYVRNEIYHGSKSTTNELFLKGYLRNFVIIIENISTDKENYSTDILFPIYVRINQGRLTSFVLNKFSDEKKIDMGERLFKTILSSFIPRLFWPNKPEAGGKVNVKYYADLTTEKASMNVGPPGEAFGSFGLYGGVLYMFIFGLAISSAFMIYINISYKTPIMILWIPIVFYQSMYSMETDTMQAFNSIIKISLFIFILFKIRPSLLFYKS